MLALPPAPLDVLLLAPVLLAPALLLLAPTTTLLLLRLQPPPLVAPPLVAPPPLVAAVAVARPRRGLLLPLPRGPPSASALRKKKAREALRPRAGAPPALARIARICNNVFLLNQ